MSDLLPLATYNLNIEPYTPTPAIDVTRPVTVRITMAALNPEAYDDEKEPSTLRIVKRNPDYDDEDDLLNGDYDEEEVEEDDEEEEEEVEEKPKKKGSKKAQEQEEEVEDEDEDEEDDEDEDDEDDEFEEYILLTLSPKGQYQQAIDITIAPEEDIQFVVTGSYAVSLTGNYIKHPFDAVNIDDEDEDDEEGLYDSDEYDLTPDEDEIIVEDLDDQLDDLEDASDVEGRVEELIAQEEEDKKGKKNNNKRKQEDKEVEPETTKKSKKEKKEKKEKPSADKEKKKVEFKKDLEEGPTKKAQEKPKTKVLEGGITIEDRTAGKGVQAKKSSKVGMRYIGKLKNGKVFDKNTSGKPFVFKLGHGEVIKGWDIGVAGMSVGGERRIIIPAAYAYGKQALPGIPANSELTFDVKLVSLK